LVDGVLYLATVYGRVIALSPETGAEIWKFDPGVDPAVERGPLRTVGIFLILFLASVLVFKFARKNWVWYPLLAILLVIATWSAWLVSQATPVTVLVLFAAVAIASLLTLVRNRKWRNSPE